MVSPGGQVPSSLPSSLPLSLAARTLPTATATGGIEVVEHGYGLGPPTGLLVLRYPAAAAVPDFPELRDDFLHQVFWSPDGVLSVRRGSVARYLGADEMLWVRRGAVVEVQGLGSQTVLRACVRLAPDALTAHDSTVVAAPCAAREALLHVARPGVSVERGLAARVELLEALAAAPAQALQHASVGDSPAHRVVHALRSNPADPTGLGGWAEHLHVSAKTLQRELERHYGTTFTRLRTRTRLEAAISFLHDHSVTETAHLVGYSTSSAFVAAFTREHGLPPGRYLSARLAG